MERKKKQSEIPGTERPTVRELDEVIGEWLEAKESASSARDQAKEKRDAATERMREHADKLDRDAHDNPTYVYRDGERDVAVKLISATKLGTAVLTEED